MKTSSFPYSVAFAVLLSFVAIPSPRAQLKGGAGAAGGAAPPDLKGVPIGQWGIVSISVPAELEEDGLPSTEPNRNGDVTWTHYSRLWERKGLSDKVVFYVNTWDADWAKVTGQKKDVTPEALLIAEYLTARERKESGKEPIEELTDLELGGVRGLYEVRGLDELDRGRKGGERVFLGWHAYRNYRGKPQEINIGVFGGRKDLDRLKKVIQSVKVSN
jgi:hypothetical protein